MVLALLALLAPALLPHSTDEWFATTPVPGVLEVPAMLLVMLLVPPWLDEA